MVRTMEQIQRDLAAHRLEVVAADTGLSYNTVRRYAAGVVRTPPYESMRLISEWLDRQESKGAVRQSA